MYKWLLGPLICLVLGTASARPPECKEPPSWSINGRQPLAETKGKVTLVALLQASCQFCLFQASMLETLLKHLRSYGMNDLEFIIVNSKLPHSRDRIEELREKVSFEVFQETEEEEVWNLMEGGKDDMYIYDRCGRLTYYVPFPLSILTESPLVSNAVLATYFRSPCGDKCTENKTVDIEEVVKNIEPDSQPSNVTEEVGDQIFNVTDITPEESFESTTPTSNDILSIVDPVIEDIDEFTFTDLTNNTDYENFLQNDTSSDNIDRNTTSVDEAKSYFNSIYKLFFSNDSNNEDMLNNSEIFANETQGNLTSNLPENNNETQSQDKMKDHLHHQHHHKHHQSHHHGHHGKSEARQKKKPRRCLEADYEVCKGWSKNHLLHAQKCCTGLHTNLEGYDPSSCAHFTKKRCKKIQSILKCCIKTVQTASSTAVPSMEDVTEAQVEDETEMIPQELTTSPSQVTEASEVTPKESNKESKSAGINCCKSTVNGPSCRVSFTGCTADEYTYHAPGPAKCQNSACRTTGPLEGSEVLQAERLCQNLPCRMEKTPESNSVFKFENPCQNLPCRSDTQEVSTSQNSLLKAACCR